MNAQLAQLEAQALARLEAAASQLMIRAPFFGVLLTKLKRVCRPDVGTMATDGIHLFYSPAYVMAHGIEVLIGTLAHEVFHCALKHFVRLGAMGKDVDMKMINRAADCAINPILKNQFGFKLWPNHYDESRFHGIHFEEIYAVLRRDARQAQNGNGKGASQPGAGTPSPSAGQSGKPGAQPSPSPAQGAGNGQAQPSPAPGATPGAQGATPSPSAQPSTSPGNGAPGAQPSPAGQAQPGAGTGNGAPQPGAQPGNGSGAGTGTQGAQPSPMGTPGAGNGTPSTSPSPTPDDMADINGMGGIMAPGDGSPVAVDEVAAQWEVWVSDAVRTAERMAGIVPGMFKRMIDAPKDGAQLDYHEIFRDFIDSKISTDYSFSRPNRRLIGSGFYVPGAVNDALEELIWIVDSSGSIDNHMLRNAAREPINAAEDGRIERLVIVSADTEVRHVQEFERGDDIAADLDIRGGGGTRFDLALAHVAEHYPNATAIIYMTDLEVYGDKWGVDPGIPLLWAVHGDSRDYARRAPGVPFGETAYIGRLEF